MGAPIINNFFDEPHDILSNELLLMLLVKLILFEDFIHQLCVNVDPLPRN
jgi:hypothetical protein